MKRSTVTTLLFSMFLLTLWSCSKKEVADNIATPHLPATPYLYSSSGVRVAAISWAEGHVVLKSAEATPVTNDGAKLGRVLFHDYTISARSCNSCHNGSITGHSGRDFFGQPDHTGTFSSAGQSIHPPVGMEDAGTLVAKISSTSYYQQLFRDAYGTSEVTTGRISDALAQYMSAMAGSTATDQRFADPFK